MQSARGATRRDAATESIEAISDGRLLTRCLVLDLSNPKAVLAWIAVLALGASSSNGGGSGVAATTGLCAMMGLAIYLVFAVLFSQAPIRSAYRKARRGIDGLSAAFFGCSVECAPRIGQV